MTKKRFDCVEFQHRAGERLMRKMEGMTVEERAAYWKKRGDALRELQRQLREKAEQAPTAEVGLGTSAQTDEHAENAAKLLDQVVLAQDLPEHGLRAGDIGAVVFAHAGGQAYEVEFMTLDGETLAVVTVTADQVRPVAPHEIAHARAIPT